MKIWLFFLESLFLRCIYFELLFCFCTRLGDVCSRFESTGLISSHVSWFQYFCISGPVDMWTLGSLQRRRPESELCKRGPHRWAEPPPYDLWVRGWHLYLYGLIAWGHLAAGVSCFDNMLNLRQQSPVLRRLISGFLFSGWWWMWRAGGAENAWRRNRLDHWESHWTCVRVGGCLQVKFSGRENGSWFSLTTCVSGVIWKTRVKALGSFVALLAAFWAGMCCLTSQMSPLGGRERRCQETV